MTIKTSPPPTEAIDALRSGINRLRVMPAAFPANAPAGGLCGGHDPDWEDGLPHPIYTLAVEEGATGRGLETARFAGWRFLLGPAGQAPSAAAEVYYAAGRYEFAGFNFGPFVAQTLSAMKQAQAHADLRNGDFEPRLLRVLALDTVALWLKERNIGSDILIPLEPTPPDLQPGRHYTSDEFMAEMGAMRSRRTGSSSETSNR